jgi:hypothetical protein
MSYKNLIDSSLNLAFNQLKDLAEDFIYIKKTSSTFDFNTSLVTDTSVTYSAKTVIVGKEKSRKDFGVVSMQLLAKTKEIGNISNFDSVIYNNETWTISDNIKDNGFISLFSVIRESSNG